MSHSSSLRAAAEHLVLSIAGRNHELIKTVMQTLLGNDVLLRKLPAPDPKGPSDLCLTLDAVLAAFGVCFFHVQDAIDFKAWLGQHGLR